MKPYRHWARAPSIILKRFCKTYNNRLILDNIDLTFNAGELSVVLGPSGCGKSTLLRLIAGLDESSQGQVLINDEDVTRKPPEARGCAMVFQNYALYPHMRVRENIGYALKLAGVDRSERDQRVLECAKSLGIDTLLERKPAQLSGGQRQRVAIGRALVRKPAILLFDEPLSNLDNALRHELRQEIRRLHKEIGATILYVTHDQTEAMSLADRVIVLNQGRVEQVGAPCEIYDYPNSTFVASFIGTPSMNLLPVRRDPSNGLYLTDGQRLPYNLNGTIDEANHYVLGLRAQAMSVTTHGLMARVESSENLGSHTLLYCDLAGQPCVVSHPGRTNLAQGDWVRITILETPLLFDLASGLRQPLSLVPVPSDSCTFFPG